MLMLGLLENQVVAMYFLLYIIHFVTVIETVNYINTI